MRHLTLWPGSPVHSKNAFTGTRQRRLRYATRNAGVLASVSARALMQRAPNFSSLAHTGTRPQRSIATSRSRDSCERRTTGAVLVGRMSGFGEYAGTTGTMNLALIAAGLSDRSYRPHIASVRPGSPLASRA